MKVGGAAVDESAFFNKTTLERLNGRLLALVFLLTDDLDVDKVRQAFVHLVDSHARNVGFSL
mgnify:CR=1 FL=1